MKKFLSAGALISITLFTFSCGNKTAVTGTDSMKNDSANTANAFVLEDLLRFKTQADVEKKFGKDRVKFDTIWGAEGMWGMGTYIDKGTKDEVQISWAGDSVATGGVVAVAVQALYDSKTGNETYDSKWVSSSGLKLGMTTGELEKLNGRPFTFSGFGWDYGGGVMDWKGGTLDRYGVGVGLSEGTTQLDEKEMEQVLGDHDVMSDNPVVKKMQPKVSRIAVFPASEK